MTREEWLLRSTKHIARIVERQAKIDVPAVWVSVGWPKGARGRGKTIGQCWHGTSSADGRPHVFISPALSDAGMVLATLAHELVHAATGDSKHKAPFIAVGRAIGLEPPWTATTAGPELGARLASMLVGLGPYPHAELREPASAHRPGSRLRLWECPCGVKVRVASDAFKATCDQCGKAFKR